MVTHIFPHAWALGTRVTKQRGSRWTGRVVGYYSTELTKVGYCVESENEPGSVQVYPQEALCLCQHQETPNVEELLHRVSSLNAALAEAQKLQEKMHKQNGELIKWKNNRLDVMKEMHDLTRDATLIMKATLVEDGVFLQHKPNGEAR